VDVPSSLPSFSGGHFRGMAFATQRVGQLMDGVESGGESWYGSRTEEC